MFKNFKSKSFIKGFIAGMLCLALLVPATVFAGTMIDVTFDSINITLNGNRVQQSNILYKGTTYVPLRAISEMLGLEVNWDGNTRTASLTGSTASTTPQPVASTGGYWQLSRRFVAGSLHEGDTLSTIAGTTDKSDYIFEVTSARTQSGFGVNQDDTWGGKGWIQFIPETIGPNESYGLRLEAKESYYGLGYGWATMGLSFVTHLGTKLELQDNGYYKFTSNDATYLTNDGAYQYYVTKYGGEASTTHGSAPTWFGTTTPEQGGGKLYAMVTFHISNSSEHQVVYEYDWVN